MEYIMNAWKRIPFICLSFLILGLAPIGAALAQVKVTAANPSSASQGTISLDVIVTGSGFDKTAKAQYFVSGTTNTGGITVRGTKFNSSTELVTTIDVADTALLANFDIVVTLDTGRKGKGTTLFSVTAKPTKTTPTYPPARDSQGFTSNGGTTTETSRLYMFGGNKDGTAIADLWVYANAGSTGAAWSYIPGGTSAPSARAYPGWSCGAGLCVLTGGMSTSYKADTWILSESARTWSQVTCGRRAFCPSARSGSAMAYDSAHGVHVLFGGDENGLTLVADTYTFNASTKTWKQVSGGVAPSARYGATAVFVPAVGGVVMFGGADNNANVFKDMYLWNGTAWSSVTSVMSGSTPTRTVPALWGHSMAWDSTRGAMIVAGGFFDTGWFRFNSETWHVTFSNPGGAWQATWTLASPQPACQSAASTPDQDSVVHKAARMAFDAAAGVQVFFGGRDGGISYGNTVECR
jgi:hypothetical protein